MVVSCEAKKEQSNLPKTMRRTIVCLTWANFFVIWRHNHSQYILTPVNFLNLHCRHTIFFPTLTNAPKIKAISEVVCCSQHRPWRWISFLLLFLTEVVSSPFSIVTFLKDLHYRYRFRVRGWSLIKSYLLWEQLLSIFATTGNLFQNWIQNLPLTCHYLGCL